MVILHKGLVAIGVFFILTLTANADEGIASFTTDFTSSACYGSISQGSMVAGANDTLWDNGAICGKMFNVTCTGATNDLPLPCKSETVTVKIVDHCENCDASIVLSDAAFSRIANPDAGRVIVEFSVIV